MLDCYTPSGSAESRSAILPPVVRAARHERVSWVRTRITVVTQQCLVADLACASPRSPAPDILYHMPYKRMLDDGGAPKFVGKTHQPGVDSVGSDVAIFEGPLDWMNETLATSYNAFVFAQQQPIHVAQTVEIWPVSALPSVRAGATVEADVSYVLACSLCRVVS